MATLLERIRAIRVLGGHFRLFFGDVDSGVRADRPSLDEAEKALAAVVDTPTAGDAATIEALRELADELVVRAALREAERDNARRGSAVALSRVAELEALVREGGRKLLRSAYNDDCALGAKLLQAVNGPPVPAEMGDC